MKLDWIFVLYCLRLSDAVGAGNVVRAGHERPSLLHSVCGVAAILRVSGSRLRQDDRPCWCAWLISR